MLLLGKLFGIYDRIGLLLCRVVKHGKNACVLCIVCREVGSVARMREIIYRMQVGKQ